ncbi:MAG: NAD(P)/FAD-dependent oxidoreductase [Gammaproteobacteria bacterium]
MSNKYDVIIIGAGAAGMMCAIESGKRGKSVLLVDHAAKIAEKIRISGGGRCNFTNINTNPKNFISQNPNFSISALNQYTPHDFIELIKKHNIAYHEKTLGQLFCDHKSQLIIDMLLSECNQANVKIKKSFVVDKVEKVNDDYIVINNNDKYFSKSLVIATGGLSIPKIGATDFGYKIASQFNLNIVETQPALVPLTFTDEILSLCNELSGLSLNANISQGNISFEEGMLFTHRGLSGPSILQISSYWSQGDSININLCPRDNLGEILQDKKNTKPKQNIISILCEFLPKRLAMIICDKNKFKGNISELSKQSLDKINNIINSWRVTPKGSEGYRTAEVTRGGVDTDEISSKTMMCRNHPGLFFIGEVVDVTGHLGGYNFQWAWSSGFVAGQYT